MKTLIVYNHPYDKSFCHAILEESIAAAKKANHSVQVIDLDKDGFNPVMTATDLKGFVTHQAQDPQAMDYIKQVQDADQLVLIFPIWWELMPALMKGFIDKVIFPGSVYEQEPNQIKMKSKLTKLKHVEIITTMNTPKPLYATLYGNAIHRALVRGTFKKIGISSVHWTSFNRVKSSSPAKREKWLKQVSKLF